MAPVVGACLLGMSGLVGAGGLVGAAEAGPRPGGYRPPLRAGAVVVTPFDPPVERWLAGHRGVDLTAAPLAEVVAPAGGVVHFAGTVAGRPVVSLRHPDGVRTTYEPVVAVVATGAEVRAGEVIGRVRVGHPGCPVVACLHWGALAGDPDPDYIDPMSLLDSSSRVVRLKPLTEADREGWP